MLSLYTYTFLASTEEVLIYPSLVLPRNACYTCTYIMTENSALHGTQVFMILVFCDNSCCTCYSVVSKFLVDRNTPSPAHDSDGKQTLSRILLCISNESQYK
jgi:hypothetical protein